MNRFVLAIALLALALPLASAAATEQASLIGHLGTIGASPQCATLNGWGCYTANPNLSVPVGGTATVYALVANTTASPLQVGDVDFGIAYDPARLRVDSWSRCGDMEIPSSTWPASGSGTDVIWAMPASAGVVMAGWFRVTVLAPNAYMYLQGYGGNPPTVNGSPLRYPAYLSFNGQGGYNLCESVEVQPETWGAVKSLYR